MENRSFQEPKNKPGSTAHSLVVSRCSSTNLTRDLIAPRRLMLSEAKPDNPVMFLSLHLRSYQKSTP